VVISKLKEADIPSHNIFISNERLFRVTYFDLTGSSSGPTDTFLDLKQNYIWFEIIRNSVSQNKIVCYKLKIRVIRS
jgi:hypothetical protein